jgi:hypothetical protein
MQFVSALLLFSGDQANGCIVATAYLTAFGGYRFAAASALLISGALAIFEIFSRHHTGVRRLWLLTFPQTMLTIAACWALYAIWMGHYADGVPRPWQFILMDQLPLLTMAYVHASGIWRRATYIH